MTDRLVWIDCEMTGLDLAHDALIEIACIVTDGQLNAADEGIDVVIKPPPEALDHVRRRHPVGVLAVDGEDDVSLLEPRVLRRVPREHGAHHDARARLLDVRADAGELEARAAVYRGERDILSRDAPRSEA